MPITNVATSSAPGAGGLAADGPAQDGRVSRSVDNGSIVG